MQNTQATFGFSTDSHPRFGRGKYSDENPPKAVLESPYFWWFRFLRLNEDYQKTVKAKGVGKCAALYKDFGDIYKVDFKTWWGEHKGLFAEPPVKYRMVIANNADEIAPFNSDEVLNLVVPLSWSQRSLKKKFATLVLSKIEKGKRGVSVEESKAKYKLSGKWHIEAMEAAYKIYTTKAKLVQTNNNMPWADIAILVELDIAKELTLGKKTNMTSDQRRIVTSATMRHYKRAGEFIRAAASKTFPYSK